MTKQQKTNMSDRPSQRASEPNIPFYQKRWFYIMLAIMALFSFTSFLFQITNSPGLPIGLDPSKTKQAGWSGAIPGKKLEKPNLEDESLINQRQTARGKVYEYQSEFPVYPHKIITDEDGIVILIQEQIPPDSESKLDQFIEEGDQPDLSMFLAKNAYLKGYIYLDKGLILIARPDTGTVEQKWYFAPTDEEEFMNLWGDLFSEHGSGPERLPY